MANFIRLSGAVSDPRIICDELLMAAFASDYSQSNAFFGKVKSFQYLVHAAGQDVSQLQQSIELMFTELFRNYFAMANVAVSVTNSDTEASKLVVSLEATLTTEDGQKLDLATAVQSVDGKVKEILVGDRVLWRI